MRGISIAVAAALMTAIGVGAAEPVTGSTDAAANMPQAEPEKKVCRMSKETGSRVRSKKTCATKAEWAARDDAARGNAREIANNQPGSSSPN